MPSHRQSARRRTRSWQLGAIVVLAAAGALIALPIGKLLAPAAPAFTQRPAPTQSGDPRAAIRAVSLDSAAQVLRDHGPKVEPKLASDTTKAPDAAKPEDVAAPKTPLPAAGEWVYIGSASTPNARAALVRVDNQQHMLYEGGEFNSTRLVAVEPDHITIDGPGGQRRVDLAARQIGWPTDPPKRPVVFRQPPLGVAIPTGMPAHAAAPQPIMPGAPQNPSISGARPGAPPATFDAARAAAMNAREEEMRRARAGVNPPGRSGLDESLSQEQRDIMVKTLAEPDLDPQRRNSILRDMGLKPGQPYEEIARRVKEMGFDPSDEVWSSAIKQFDQNKGEEKPE